MTLSPFVVRRPLSDDPTVRECRDYLATAQALFGDADYVRALKIVAAANRSEFDLEELRLSELIHLARIRKRRP